MGRFVWLFGRCSLNLSRNQASQKAAKCIRFKIKIDCQYLHSTIQAAYGGQSGPASVVQLMRTRLFTSIENGCQFILLKFQMCIFVHQQGLSGGCMFYSLFIHAATNTLCICRAYFGKQTFLKASFIVENIPFQFCETCTESFIP